MKRNLTQLAALATLLGAASLAQAAPINPLHPAYYQGKVVASEPVVGETKAYVAANPLHPAYYVGRVEAPAFVGTAASPSALVIERNPLHPRFVR